MRLAIVVARFNELVTRLLLAGALETAARHGVAEADIEVLLYPMLNPDHVLHGIRHPRRPQDCSRDAGRLRDRALDRH
jgi:hypothetical protein